MVTSAALIMVTLFSIFLTMPLIEFKILGIGMGAAILIDATIVRGVLLPAALSLPADRAWHRRAGRGSGAAPLRYQPGHAAGEPACRIATSDLPHSHH